MKQKNDEFNRRNENQNNGWGRNHQIGAVIQSPLKKQTLSSYDVTKVELVLHHTSGNYYEGCVSYPKKWKLLVSIFMCFVQCLLVNFEFNLLSIDSVACQCYFLMQLCFFFLFPAAIIICFLLTQF